VLVAGAGLTSLATLGLVLAHDDVWQLWWRRPCSVSHSRLFDLIVEAVLQSRTGVASGMNANIRTVGGALRRGIASVVTANARPDGLRVESGYTHGFAVLVITSGLAALVAALVPVVEARTHGLPVSQGAGRRRADPGAGGQLRECRPAVDLDVVRSVRHPLTRASDPGPR